MPPFGVGADGGGYGRRVRRLSSSCTKLAARCTGEGMSDSKTDTREERLAAALRENLRRRKVQARDVSATSSDKDVDTRKD